jgi:hypothetical protein
MIEIPGLHGAIQAIVYIKHKNYLAVACDNTLHLFDISVSSLFSLR